MSKKAIIITVAVVVVLGLSIFMYKSHLANKNDLLNKIRIKLKDERDFETWKKEDVTGDLTIGELETLNTLLQDGVSNPTERTRLINKLMS